MSDVAVTFAVTLILTTRDPSLTSRAPVPGKTTSGERVEMEVSAWGVTDTESGVGGGLLLHLHNFCTYTCERKGKWDRV